MSKKETINVQGTEVILLSHQKEDYISLTDMAKYKDSMEPSLVISHWMSTRYTIEFMGIWESINNPDFKPTEFGRFKNESGNGEVKILTAKEIFVMLPHWNNWLCCRIWKVSMLY